MLSQCLIIQGFIYDFKVGAGGGGGGGGGENHDLCFCEARIARGGLGAPPREFLIDSKAISESN